VDAETLKTTPAATVSLVDRHADASFLQPLGEAQTADAAPDDEDV
jgi:hypothetical protein